MTPLHIEILFHYLTRANDYRDGDFSAPAVREFIAELESKDMLRIPIKVSKQGDPVWQITERGIFFLDYICSLPLPVSKFAMPEVKP